MKCHPRPRTASLPALADRLRRKSRKFTGARQAILQVLRRHANPMSIKEIFQDLAARECNLTTVYRSLHLLESMGIVQRFDFGDGVARFELLDEGQNGHHHHLVCTRCSNVVELQECGMSDLEESIARRNRFAGITHKLEFFGVCPDCQK